MAKKLKKAKVKLENLQKEVTEVKRRAMERCVASVRDEMVRLVKRTELTEEERVNVCNRIFQDGLVVFGCGMKGLPEILPDGRVVAYQINLYTKAANGKTPQAPQAPKV